MARADAARTEKCLDVIAVPGDGEDDDPDDGEVVQIPDSELDGDAEGVN
jgi:hypothetical protein